MVNKIARSLAQVEPVWVAVCAALLFLFHILRLHPLGNSSAFLWVWLVLCLVPIVARRMVFGRIEFATPFDVSIILLMLGALIGVIVSPRRDVSVGAYQCMLAICLLYYSWLTHPGSAKFLRFVLPLTLLALLTAFLVILPRLVKSLPNTYHGLAMCLLIAAVVLGGVAIFRTDRRTRIAAGLVALCLLVATFIIVHESMPRLFLGDSVDGRLPRWKDTVSFLLASPFTGLGLGCWAFVYHDSMIIDHPTNVHNAYLELYSNTGVLGVIALVIALVVGLKLALQIVKSPRDSKWYGLGIGVVAACLCTLLIGLLESAPIGVAVPQPDTYLYVVSPIPWILGGLLVVAHRLITKGSTV